MDTAKYFAGIIKQQEYFIRKQKELQECLKTTKEIGELVKDAIYN